MNLLGGTIFGFPSIFPTLIRQGIYRNRCEMNEETCSQQIEEYQVKSSLFSSFSSIDLFRMR